MSENPSSRNKVDLSAKKIVAGWPNVGYDAENDAIREFYAKSSGTVKSRTSMFAGKKLADIFIFAMTLGKNAGIKKEYDKKSDRKDSINMEYIANQPEYLWMMIAIAMEESQGDLKLFQEPRKIINICEQYANYGIELLMEMEGQASTSDPFSGYEEKFTELLE
jgi:hypothetical protein